MKVDLLGIKGTWREIANSCNTTVNKEAGTKEPSKKWKKSILLAEHSPIRQLVVKWKWYDIPRWVSDHFVRHKFGIEHWVKTDRSDRTGIDRSTISQCSLTNHECEGNAQALINMSRKRLCQKASPETREAHQYMLELLQEPEPELVSACVPECIYRGFCPEFQSCGYANTQAYQLHLERYRNRNES